MPRNNFLFANAIYLLSYTGAGSGIQRAMSEDNRLTFSNNEALHEFMITIARDVNTNSDTLSPDLDTKRQNLDTDSDTFSPDLDTKRPNLDTKQHIKLNKRLKDVVNYCTIPRSSKEILKRIKVILYFHQDSPSQKRSLQEKFPILDVLVTIIRNMQRTAGQRDHFSIRRNKT